MFLGVGIFSKYLISVTQAENEVVGRASPKMRGVLRVNKKRCVVKIDNSSLNWLK